jgi:YfiR/HmsC-like
VALLRRVLGNFRKHLVGHHPMASRRRLIPRVICLAFSGFLFWLVLNLSALAQSESPTEHQVKAAFLYNFAKFVEWPAEAFAAPNAPLKLCVLGEDPFGSDLTELVHGKVVNGHGVQVLNPQNLQQSINCHILFVSPSEKSKTRQIVESLRDKSVLTVGDTKGFSEQGGMVNFVLENDRVRFEINVTAAERARLKISSKLLNVAKLVIT